MTLLTTWPPYIDDLGDGVSGTETDLAFFDAMKAAIDDVLESATNPGVNPVDITDEVIAARGTEADLDTRISVEHNPDGSHKPQAGLVSQAQAGASWMKNLMPDSQLLLWPDGDALAPEGWTLAGIGATVARCGAGLGDVTVLDYSPWCALLTYVGGVATLTKSLVVAADFNAGYRGKTITLAVRCLASTPNQASVIVDDGVVQTRGGSLGNATYHTGDGVEGWIYCTHTFSAVATKLDIILQVALVGTGGAYFGAQVLVLGEVVPTVWFPERWGELPLQLTHTTPAAGDDPVNAFVASIPRACILREVVIKAGTAPGGGILSYDPLKNGADACFSGVDVLQLASGVDNNGVDGQAPDGTYANRCFTKGDSYEIDTTTVSGAPADVRILSIFVVPMPELDLLRV
jgi:hypothetical protein